jgi:hypothetical protein
MEIGNIWIPENAPAPPLLTVMHHAGAEDWFYPDDGSALTIGQCR